MEPEDEGRRVVRWLDRALAEYSPGEPPAGLEDRILARLRARGRRAETAAPRWSLGVAAAAVTLAAILLVRQLRVVDTVAPPVTQEAGASTPVPVPPLPPAGGVRPSGTVRSSAAGAVAEHATERAGIEQPRPRADRFPTPTPLSEQEQLLLRYVDESPRAAVLEARAYRELRERERVEWESRSAAEPDDDDPPR